MRIPIDPIPIYEAGMDYIFDTQNTFSLLQYSQTEPPQKMLRIQY